LDIASVDHALTTTRSVRKRLDFSRPVERRVIEECLEIALQAPSGSNRQGWHFMVVTDAEKRRAIASIYREQFKKYAAMAPQVDYAPGDPRRAQHGRVLESATYLAEHMHECPVFVIPCIEGRPQGSGTQAGFWGSILPAAWSFMIAARTRGLGTAWTSMHLVHEAEVSRLLGIPEDVSQAVLLPVAYFKGDDFKPAQRLPLAQVTHWDSW